MLSKIYSYGQLLSLDVVLGAICSALFLSSFLEIVLPYSVLSCLALAVWIIYTADHLIDAYKIRKAATSARHTFHQRHFTVLITLVILASGITIYIVVTLIPPNTRIWGLYLGAIVLVYFGILVWWKPQSLFFKETMVAAIYTSGIFLGPLSIMSSSVPTRVWPFIIQFWLLALVNLLEFSLFEQEADRSDNQGSLVLKIGLRRTRRLIRICLILLVLSTSPLIFYFWPDIYMIKAQVLIFLMTLALSTLTIFEEYFEHKQRYRKLGDGAFIFPILFV